MVDDGGVDVVGGGDDVIAATVGDRFAVRWFVGGGDGANGTMAVASAVDVRNAGACRIPGGPANVACPAPD